MKIKRISGKSRLLVGINKTNQLEKQHWLVFTMTLFILTIMSWQGHATPATLVVDSTLKDSPGFQAKNLFTVKKGQSVEIKKRQGGWYQVQLPNKKAGWLTMLQVKFQRVTPSKKKGSKYSEISLRRGGSNITATTGVRGIGEADIKNAKADFNALEIAKRFKVSEKEAKSFAGKIPLKSQSIKYQGKRHD
ncbi:SH3 domain-containing protein [Aliikangiella coralliicola]|nr:SH3 domain-containing protein [Aliikangiella coralliicola]